MPEPINVFVMNVIDHNYDTSDIHCMVQNHTAVEGSKPIPYTRDMSFAANYARIFVVQGEDVEYFFQHLMMHRIYVLREYEGVLKVQQGHVKKKITALQAAKRKKLPSSTILKEKWVMSW